MRNIDEKDLEIVELLLEDARRPYSEIAQQVDLSPPTVSDRIERLRANGVVRRFTLDIDESQINDHTDLLVEFDVEAGHAEEIEATLDELAVSERVYRTAENDVIAELRTRAEHVQELISSTIDMGPVNDHTVRIITSSSWTPSICDAGAETERSVSPPATIRD